VAGVYNRAAYAAEKRQALELRGEHVASLVAGSKPRLRHAQKASLTKARQSGDARAQRNAGVTRDGCSRLQRAVAARRGRMAHAPGL
jgi:hypothetical protein